MIPGLPQGFVKVDSLAWAILRAYHQYGALPLADLMEIVGGNKAHVSMTLFRLERYGFIWKQDRASKYDTGFDRTQWIYGLKFNPGGRYRTRKKTPAERQARFRQKRIAVRANSIFNIGATQLNVQVSDRVS